MIASATVGDSRHSHPVVFLVLILPWGLISGYLTVAVAYLLAQAGVSTEQIAGLIALSFIPQTWKFIWAPIVDTTLTRRNWYVMAALVTALGIFALGALPATATSLALLTAVTLVAYLAGTFLCMSVESLIAYTVPPEEKGRASGWLQAGNLGSGGLGGRAGLWMAGTFLVYGWQVQSLGLCVSRAAWLSGSFPSHNRDFAVKGSGVIS